MTVPVKERFSSLDTLALVREIGALPKAWIDKAFDMGEDRVLLSLRLAGGGRRELYCHLGRFAVLRSEPWQKPSPPGALSTEIRRWVQGAPLLGVWQPPGERYLEFTVGRGPGADPVRIAIELFGSGNLILTRGTQIVWVAHPREWAQRSLRPGETYVRPPAREDMSQRKPGEVLALLQRSRTDLATTLAAKLGLGGPLAEELVVRSGLDPRRPASQVSRDDVRALLDAFPTLADDIGPVPAGYLYRSSEGRLVDVEPFPSERWRRTPGIVEEIQPYFSDAAWTYFHGLTEEERAAGEAGPQDELRRSLERQREVQRRAAEALGAAIETKKRQAEWIFVHYAEIEDRRRDRPPEEPLVVEIEGSPLEIEPEIPPRAVAQRLYDEAKELSAKREGVLRALADTESRLRAGPPAREARPSEGLQGPGRVRTHRTRHFWFEKAPRWMITSQAHPAVGGRNARTNDAIVRRYLRENDLYFHADIHGAPSVVLRRPGEREDAVGPEGLRQVAQWAVCLSKAWRVGLASADAFWVLGNQVTKAGGSGEFVAPGSWVIHGTKNYLRDLPLEVSLGYVELDGERLLQCAPPEAFSRAGSEVLVDLRPGDERERDREERELSRRLGLPRDLLQSLLPPGGLTIGRR